MSLRQFSRWDFSLIVPLMAVSMPLLALIWIAFFPVENIWPHLWATSLPRYFWNSVYLMGLVASFAILIGVSCAWLVSQYQFFGRRFFHWALFLPLAVPSYIGAYAFVDFWEYAGPVQTTLRSIFGWETSRDYWFFETRSMGTAVFVIGLALYPYVYMLARSAFEEQSSRVVEVAQTLGAHPWQRFTRIALPMARPAIAAGAALVMMETLNDFGAVEFFAIQTLTTGIFTTWLEANNLGGAAQVALVLLALVFVLLFIERRGRKGVRVDQKSNANVTPALRPLRGFAGLGATLLCALPILFGFIMPFGIMAHHAINVDDPFSISAFFEATGNAIWVASMAGLVTVTAALFLVFSVRMNRSLWRARAADFTVFGYALPGAVLAVGVLIPLAWFDRHLADFIEYQFGIDIGLLLTGSAFAIILAISVRFFALAMGSVTSGIERVSPNLLHSGRALGHSPLAVLWRIYIPLLKGPILIAMLLVFVDAIKELPATLLLRPFGFETLSTLIYNAASREDIEGASLGSLVVIGVSLIAVLFVARAFARR